MQNDKETALKRIYFPKIHPYSHLLISGSKNSLIDGNPGYLQGYTRMKECFSFLIEFFTFLVTISGLWSYQFNSIVNGPRTTTATELGCAATGRCAQSEMKNFYLQLAKKTVFLTKKKICLCIYILKIYSLQCFNGILIIA